MRFSTEDKDQDKSLEHCARRYSGGWWYSGCHRANLNGPYYGKTVEIKERKGISWVPWHSFQYSIKAAEMKIQPVK
jgi:ficolin